MRQKITFLTGAGISAESGIATFRDKDGLWEGHDVMEVASPQGWANDQNLVLDFYNQRRQQLLTVQPNSAHKDIALLEEHFDIQIITQNVDDLHERGGSSNVMHLHGELLKVRSQADPSLVQVWKKDLKEGDLCKHGMQLRPHIVWFGELVPMLEQAIPKVQESNTVVVIGTSLQVYPAASLIAYASSNAKIYYIDPKPFISHELSIRKHEIIEKKATEGMQTLKSMLIS